MKQLKGRTSGVIFSGGSEIEYLQWEERELNILQLEERELKKIIVGGER